MGVFFCCKGLKEITLPSGLEEVYFAAFAYCESLEKIRFPKSIQHIDSYAINICKNLKQIEIPLSMKEDFAVIKKKINSEKVYPKVIYY